MVKIPAEVVAEIEYGISIAVAKIETDLGLFICSSPDCSYEKMEDEAWRISSHSKPKYNDIDSEEALQDEDASLAIRLEQDEKRPLPAVYLLMKEYFGNARYEISHFEHIHERFCRTSQSAKIIREAKSVLNEARQSMRYKAAKNTKRKLGSREEIDTRSVKQIQKDKVDAFVSKYRWDIMELDIKSILDGSDSITEPKLLKAFEVKTWDELERKARRMVVAIRKRETARAAEISGKRSFMAMEHAAKHSKFSGGGGIYESIAKPQRRKSVIEKQAPAPVKKYSNVEKSKILGDYKKKRKKDWFSIIYVDFEEDWKKSLLFSDKNRKHLKHVS